VIFRGGAIGEEAPVRTIQGARTGCRGPNRRRRREEQRDRRRRSRRSARPRVSPHRGRRRGAHSHESGPKTKLLQIVGVSVDPVRDVLVVSTYSRLPGASPAC